jgi:putative FmdB family regulatory protein
MPTYEYECDGCQHAFEEFQSILAEPLKVCPKCGEPKLRRLFGIGSAVVFKGSGFYQTDYRSESYKAAAKADSDKTTGKADSKDKPAGDSVTKPPEKSSSETT